MSDGLNVAPAAAAVILGGAVGPILLAPRWRKVNVVTGFWVAYVVTWSLGTSLGDLLTAMPRDGGVGLGERGTTASALVVLVVLLSLSATRAHWRRKPAR